MINLKKINPQSEKKTRHSARKKNYSQRSFFAWLLGRSAKQKRTARQGQKFARSHWGAIANELRFGFTQNNQISTTANWLIPRHLLLISLFILVVFCLLFFRFSYLSCNLFNHSQYCQTRNLELDKNAKLAETNLIYATPRNNIIDRNGEILAMDLKNYHLVIDPKKIAPYLNQSNQCSVNRFYQIIQPYLADSLNQFAEFNQMLEINSSRSYKRLAKLSLSDRENLYQQLVSENSNQKSFFKCEFVNLNESFYQRHYPYGEVISSLIGFVGLTKSAEEILTPFGQKGVEKLFEKQLALEPSYQKIIRSRKTSQIVRVNPYDDSHINQSPVTLSLDIRAQNIVYQELKKTIEGLNAQKGGAILINGKTGEVLALASYPSFNPNDSFSKAKDHLKWNHVYQSNITPGSTLKPFVLASAIENGVIDGDFEVDTDEEVIWSNGKRVLDSSKYGQIDANEVVVFSSNIGIIKMIRLIDPDHFANHLFALDLAGHKVFGLSAETKGQLKTPYQWSDAYYDYLSTGYSLTTTLSHLVRSYSVFTNDGMRVDLTLIKQDQNKVIPKMRVFEKSTIDQMLPVLKQVVDVGTATKAQIEGVDVYGKTGTSQILEKIPVKDKNGEPIIDQNGNQAYRLGYANDKHRAIFVGFTPKEEQSYIMAVYVDEPQGYSYYGGTVAAPIFSRSIKQILKLN